MIAVGTDILKIDRIDEVLDRLGDRFVQRILTPVEQEEYGQSAQAVSWQDIQIEHDTNGAPLVRLSGGAERVARERGGSRVELSLADELDYVVAFAVLAK
jgi:holo-[acyl-carrier protein] synthase